MVNNKNLEIRVKTALIYSGTQLKDIAAEQNVSKAAITNVLKGRSKSKRLEIVLSDFASKWGSKCG